MAGFGLPRRRLCERSRSERRNNLDSPRLVLIAWTGVKYAYDGTGAVQIRWRALNLHRRTLSPRRQESFKTDLPLSTITKDMRDRRPLIFLAVLMIHIVIVLLVIRAVRIPVLLPTSMNKSLMLLLLRHNVDPTTSVSARRHPAGQPRSATLEPSPSKPRTASPDATSIAAEPPKIDWETEAELAAQSAVANAGRESHYRNLSALSPEQLSWVRQNHLEQANPGIPWKYRRVEVTAGGFPIIHINDNCVAIPLLMMMVFCKIGHVESKGDLFEHMRDPHDP